MFNIFFSLFFVLFLVAIKFDGSHGLKSEKTIYIYLLLYSFFRYFMRDVEFGEFVTQIKKKKRTKDENISSTRYTKLHNTGHHWQQIHLA